MPRALSRGFLGLLLGALPLFGFARRLTHQPSKMLPPTPPSHHALHQLDGPLLLNVEACTFERVEARRRRVL
jgi:hypothetical protein